MMRYFLFCLLFFSCLASAGVGDALKNGDLLLDMRLRLESVDLGSLDDDAFAPTLRTRLGYRTEPYQGWSFTIDFENITAISDDSYNDTKNGNGTRPVVADPEDTELNQVNLTYAFAKNRRIILGRQRLILDNARFVGNVGWRQNEQTYDGVLYKHGFGEKHDLTLGYLANANRIFGEHHPNPIRADLRQQSYLANMKMKLPIGTLAIFGYFFDIDDLPATSHRNLGFRLNGKHKASEQMTLLYELSYVDQDSFADGSDIIDAEYIRASLGSKWANLTLQAHYEVLGGDGNYGFSTPLATLHAFNGWADIYLGTPANGLVDTFLQIAYAKSGWKAAAFYHNFESDQGSTDYGTELDMVVTRKFTKKCDGGLKLADFSSDTRAPDATKIWLWAHYKF